MTTLARAIQDKYGAIASHVTHGTRSCCGPDACGCGDPISTNLYSDEQTAGLPADAVRASLGCGNPTAVADLHTGDVVLDLGSGGGIDVLLSAKRVGPTGKAFGLDMTDEMLALARQNARAAGASNVEFLKGSIEAIPLPDQSVDVIISNCVINLSGDKDAVFREAFRVLKPGGRLAVSDVVVRGSIADEVRQNIELWTGCIAGALEESDYVERLRRAGFADVRVTPWRVYTSDDARGLLAAGGIDVTDRRAGSDGEFASAFIRATKPQEQPCCGPSCCA